MIIIRNYSTLPTYLLLLTYIFVRTQDFITQIGVHEYPRSYLSVNDLDFHQLLATYYAVVLTCSCGQISRHDNSIMT